MRLRTTRHIFSFSYSIVLVVLLWLGTNSQLFSQTGPGGVGSNTDNIIWLRADDLSVGDGGAVATWADTSGNDNDFTQGVGGLQPTLQTNELNGHSVVRFDGGDALKITTLTSTQGDHTIFGVAHSSTETYVFDNTDGDRFLVAIHSNGAYWDGAWQSTGATIGTGTTTEVLSWVLDDAGANVYVDGTFLGSDTWDANSRIGGTQVLGARQDESTQMMTGDMAEWIVYEGAINAAQRIIIESYLGAKYGITVSSSVYGYGATHDGDIVGIGQSASATHSESVSGGILRVDNASSLDTDGDFLMMGHDEGSIAAWTSTESPDATNVLRLAREWRVQESGDIGTVSLAVDTTSFPAYTADYEFIQIWVDSDGDFSSGATSYPVTLNGDDEYEATGVDLSTGDYVMIASFRPEMEFSASTSNGFESVAAPTMTINLNYKAARNITVDFTDAGTGSADEGGGNDFTVTGSTATITAGTNSVDIALSINDDGDEESDETVDIYLSNPSDGQLGDVDEHTYTINDNDDVRVIDFQTASSSSGEGTTPASVTIELDVADGSNPTTVDYTISGGSATGSGTDYTLASGTATIASGLTTTTIDISIVDDLLNEDDETIILQLSNPSNANLGTDLSHTFTITDDDAEPTVELLSSASYVSEGVGSKSILVGLSTLSGFDVAVDYTVGGTATGGGTDYTLVDGTATITAGSSTATILLSIQDDASEESAETVTITISNPSGATLGATTLHTVTINDNENDGITGPGGVGNSDNNILWLVPEDIGGSDGDAVATWSDRSGNGNDFTQGVGGKQPTYKTGHLNGHPVVRYDGGDVLSTTTFNSTAGDHTVIGVINSSTDTYVMDNTGGGRFITSIHANGPYWDGTWQDAGNDIPRGATEQIISWVLDDAGANVYVNGAAQASGPFDGTSNISGTQTLGARQDESTQMMTGDMGDWIVFEGALNDAQRIIIENYLAAKYGLTISDDYYDYQASYGYDVAGIGREGTDTHPGALSNGMLGVASPSSLDTDGDYLLFGHDNGDVSAWTTTDAPNSGVNTYRVAREYKFDETAEVGTVSILVDITDLPAAPVGFSQYAIWVDDNGVFASGATQYQLTLEDGYYRAHGIDIDNGDVVTIGMVKPTVEFSSATGNGSETTSASVTVTLSYELGADMTVDYTVTGGTATGSGTDYTLADGTLTITAGQTSATISPSIVNDTDLESDETIEITLSDPSAGTALGDIDVHTYSINDDDNSRKIDFQTATDNGGEGTTPVTVTIEINSVDAVNPTTVDYAVSGGTATISDDFTLASGTATIAATTTTTTFDITLNDDLLNEDDETIIVTLSAPTNANLGTDQTFTFTINDDDAAPEVEFLTSTSFVSEGVSSKNIVVGLSAVSGQDVTVDYAVAGTATGAGTDYSLAAGTLTISAGSASGNITPIIIDDSDTESQETIIVTLSNPGGATLGSEDTHTLTINDNENDGFVGPGGVGNSDNNILWLVPEDIGGSDGDAIATWSDRSGNGNDFTQGTGSKQPTYKTNQLNGQPVVRYDGGDVLSTTTFTSTAGDHTVIGVMNSSTGTYVMDNTGAGRFITAVHTSGPYWDGAWQDAGNYIPLGGTEQILSWVLDDAGANVYINGTSQASGTFDGTSNISGTQTLGARQDESTQMMTGDMGDWIVFEGALNDAQRIIIENYLAAKYGLTIADDNYAYESGHGYDLAGIGQEGTDTHVAALSNSMFGITSPSTLDTDGDYLLFGHDNGDAASWTTTEAPNDGENTYRLAREYRLDESGDVGTITMLLDTSDLPAKPAGFTQYVLWVDSDGNFATGASQYELTLSGDYYEASGITFSDGDYVTMGMVKPTVQFTSTTSNGSETTSATIEVSLNFAVSEDVTVNYAVTGGTATGSGGDYTLADATLTILAGQTTADISPSIINDTDVESDETIVITLSNPSSGIELGDNNSATYSINDDDNSRKIDFQSVSSSGGEGTSPVTITVEINSVDGSNPTTVDYTASAGTATGGGTDYTLASGTATIASGLTTTTFDLVIDDDGVDEADETVIITLSNPTNSNLGTDQTYTYTITDDDAAPTVQFASTTSSGSEGTASANLSIELSAESGQDVTVDYAVTGGTATGSGTDFTLAAGTATISAGNDNGNIVIAVVDDSDIELTETIEVTISNPSGATLAANTVHTFSINDNDNAGYTGPGGVGDSDYNILWLVPEDIGGSDGDAVATWSDRSGNGNDFTQGTGSKQPTYKTGILNGRAVVRYDGGDVLSTTTFTSGAGDHTIIGVANSTTNTYIMDNTGAGRFIPAIHSSGPYWDGSWRDAANDIARGATPEVLSWVLDDAGANVYVDGASLASGTFISTANISGTQTLGARQDESTQMMTGDMGDWIVYQGALNEAQRIIVENYLAAKYALTISNDMYTETQGSDMGYDMAGIGHAGGSAYHNAAQSAGILKISDPSTLASGDYLMFGHDNASIAAWTTTEAPGANMERLAREWYVEETNDVGTVTITVDTSDFAARSAGFENFLLMVDADGDFSAGATTYPLEFLSGDEFVAYNIDLSDGDYIAIGAVQYITQATGDWDVAATWDGNVIPGSEQGGIITGAHVITMTQDETIGSLDIATGATLNIGSHTLTVDDGCITLEGSATITMTTGAIKYTKNGDQCVTANTANFVSYSNLYLETSGTKTLDGAIVVTGNLEIENGVTLDVSSGDNFSITVGGDWDNSGDFTPRDGTVTFNGGADQDIIDDGGTAEFHDLAISNTAGSVRAQDHLDVTGDLTILAGTGVLDVSNFGKNISVAGNWTNNNGASGFVQGDETVTFDGSANQTITNSAGTESFYKLNISNTGGAVQPASALDIDNTLTIMTATGVLDMATNSQDLTISGSWINNNGASGFLPGTQAVTFDNSGIVSILSSATQSFYDLNINNTGGSVRMSSDLDVTNNLTIMAGTGALDASTSGKDLTVGGNWTNNNGASGFLEGTRTVTFDGGADQTISNSTGTEGFYDIVINNSAGAVEPDAILDIANDLTINGSGVLDLSANAENMTIAGDWTNNNGASGFVPGSQRVTFDNSGNVNIYNSAGTENFYDLYISNTSGAVRSNSILDIDNDLVILATTGVLNTLVNGNNVSVGGDWINNNGAAGYLGGTETVTFDGGADQDISNSSGTETFYGLTISNSAGAVKPSSILDINDDLTISGSGVLDVATNNINIAVAGNWSNSNGASGFVGGDETVTFDGTGAQGISNAAGEEFYNLTVSKASGDLTINNEVTIGDNGTLTLTTGDVVLADKLIINGNASISGGGTSSYIQADNDVIRRMLTGNGTTIFPMGDNDDYTPLTFTLNGGTLTAAYIDVSVTDAGHPNRGAATDYITRYWTVDQSGVGGAIDYDISYTYINGDVVGTETDMHQAKYSGGSWTSGGSISTGTNTVSRTGIDGFSDFTAMDNQASALPIELIHFTANIKDDESVLLSWASSTEINNAFYTIERSADGFNYEFFGEVPGVGNSSQIQTYTLTDYNPLDGVSYYRLRQTDFDGSTAVVAFAAVEHEEALSSMLKVEVFPNPVARGGKAYISWQGSDSDEQILMLLQDISGKVHAQAASVIQQDGKLIAEMEIDTSLPPGIYLIVGTSSQGLYHKKIVVR